MDWAHTGQDRKWSLGFVKAVMKIGFVQNAGNCLTRRGSVKNKEKHAWTALRVPGV